LEKKQEILKEKMSMDVFPSLVQNLANKPGLVIIEEELARIEA